MVKWREEFELSVIFSRAVGSAKKTLNARLLSPPYVVRLSLSLFLPLPLPLSFHLLSPPSLPPYPSSPPLPPPVEFLCSHEPSAQRCDSSFSVRVAQLIVSVLTTTLTSHAGLEPHQSQTHLPSQRAQHTCDTCLTLHGSGAVVLCSELESRVKPRTLESGEHPELR